MCCFRPCTFFLFRPRVCGRALGSVAYRGPARTPYASLGSGRGLWHVLWGFKVARSLGEAFRARRAIQAHTNPRTYYIIIRLRKCPTSHVISGILNVVNVGRHYLEMERSKEGPTAYVQGKECPTAHVASMFAEQRIYPPSSYCC